jgi:hypothetical protein
MNTNLKPDRSGSASQASTSNFKGNVSRQTGNIRAVTLEGKSVIAGLDSFADSAIRESIEDTFGKTSQDAQLETDRRAYDLKDKVPNTFGRNKGSSC